MLPDRATMYIAGAGPGALDLGFWKDVYGFSYRCFSDASQRAWEGTACSGWPGLALHYINKLQYMLQCLCSTYPSR